jgi:hypothetical protein
LVVHSFFILELFINLSRQRHATSGSGIILSRKNKLVSSCVHQSGRSYRSTVNEILDRVLEFEKKGAGNMATYRDPVSCFAPLEVIERLLEIRVEAGYLPAVYLLSPDDLADYLDAYGFDVYALSEAEAEFHFGDYRAPLAPGGDHAHCSLTAH